MHLQIVFLSLLLASSSTAQDTKSTSDISQCKQMRQLENLVSLMSNSTKLQELTKNNTAKIAEIQAESSAASPKLTELQSNATLVSICAVMNAANDQVDQCLEISDLQSFIAFAGNATSVAQKTGNNATSIAAVQAKAAQAFSKLQILMSNSTLQAACPAILQKQGCESMVKIQDFIAKAGNETILNQVTKGDAMKMELVRLEVKYAQAKLEEVRSNRTFVDACMKMGMDLGKAKGAAQAATNNSGKSTANGVQVGRIQYVMLSTILMVAAGMFML